MRNTVWQTPLAAAAPPPFDTADLVALFAAAPPPTAAARGGAAASRGNSPRSGTLRLLDAKRANNLAIILSRIRLTVPQIREAVLRCDEGCLSADRLTSLLKCVPTAEEIELVLAAVEGAAAEATDEAPAPALGLAEQFVKEVGSIPRLRERLECLAFKSRFAAELQSLYADAMAVSVGCDEVRESEALRRLLGIVLAAGNTLNSGSFRGGAAGVRLECLTRLVELKSAQPAAGGRPDLLCFCLHALAPQLPDAEGGAAEACEHERVRIAADALALELASARAAAKVCTVSLSEDVRLFEAGYASVERELALGRAKGGGCDGGQFERAMGAFCAQAGAQVRNLRAELVRVEAEFCEVRSFFGEDESVTVSDFFARLSTFASQLEAVSARSSTATSAQQAKRQRKG